MFNIHTWLFSKEPTSVVTIPPTDAWCLTCTPDFFVGSRHQQQGLHRLHAAVACRLQGMLGYGAGAGDIWSRRPRARPQLPKLPAHRCPLRRQIRTVLSKEEFLGGKANRDLFFFFFFESGSRGIQNTHRASWKLSCCRHSFEDGCADTCDGFRWWRDCCGVCYSYKSETKWKERTFADVLGLWAFKGLCTYSRNSHALKSRD